MFESGEEECAEVKHQSNRKGAPISAQDAWVAATALYWNAPLVTNNVKDLSHLRNLRIHEG